MDRLFQFGFNKMIGFDKVSCQQNKSVPTYRGAGRSLLPHGGKRSKAVSSHLAGPSLAGIYRAAERAIDLGYPLNRFVSVHWSCLGIGDDKAMTATSRLLTLARDWFRDRGVKAAWLWVRENDDGGNSKGSHLHWLLHVPEPHREQFVRRVQGWALKAAGGVPRRARAVQTEPVGSNGLASRNEAAYRANLGAVLSYVAKGCDSAHAASVRQASQTIAQGPLSRPIRSEQGGRIIGKRCDWSRALGGGKAKA